MKRVLLVLELLWPVTALADQSSDTKLLRRFAEEGDAKSQFYLGDNYAHGKGVSKDFAEAVKWFRLAAEQGYADAQQNLGGARFMLVSVMRPTRSAFPTVGRQ